MVALPAGIPIPDLPQPAIDYAQVPTAHLVFPSTTAHVRIEYSNGAQETRMVDLPPLIVPIPLPSNTTAPQAPFNSGDHTHGPASPTHSPLADFDTRATEARTTYVRAGSIVTSSTTPSIRVARPIARSAASGLITPLPPLGPITNNVDPPCNGEGFHYDDTSVETTTATDQASNDTSYRASSSDTVAVTRRSSSCPVLSVKTENDLLHHVASEGMDRFPPA